MLQADITAPQVHELAGCTFALLMPTGILEEVDG